MARTIQSPGVEIKEVDLSLRPNIPVGTTVFIPGFSNQGPTDELLTVSSLSEFEQIYGLPQNAAERYMYHTVKAVFQSPANILVSRLPYGLGAGSTVADKYSVQVYPVIPRPILVDGADPQMNSIEQDTRLIAWYPLNNEQVDTGGDYVLAQSATGVLTDYSPAHVNNLHIVTNDKTAAYNDHSIIVKAGADSDVSTLSADGKFVIFRTADRITGDAVRDAINNNTDLSDHLTATGGDSDTKASGTFQFNGSDVIVEAITPGAGGNGIQVTGDNGTGALVALTSDALDGGSTGTPVEVAAVEGGAAGNITLTGGTELTTGDLQFAVDGDTATLQDLGSNSNYSITNIAADTSTGTVDSGAIEHTFNATITVGNFTGPVAITLDCTTANLAGAAEGQLQPTKDYVSVDIQLSYDGKVHILTCTGVDQDVSPAGTVTATIPASDLRDVDALVANHNADNPTNSLVVNAGGTIIVNTGSTFTLTGGADPKTISTLIAEHNTANPTQLVSLADPTQTAATLLAPLTLANGTDASDTVSVGDGEKIITLAGGLSRGLSMKVVPVGEWKFGESNPGGYGQTTLKDAVDSVIAGIPSLSAYSQDDKYWTPEVAGDPLSIPALHGYETPEVAELVSEAVNAVGWDLSASDRYYFGEPSNIELDNDQFQKTIKGEVKLHEGSAGKLANQRFNSYNDLLTKGGAGMILVNDKKFVINEKFEGYYIGISDNTNLNPATDFDAVGKLKSLSKKLGGTTGGYVNVPDQGAGTKSRLTFSVSAGFLFDQYGNKQQVGLDGSMSEVLENLSEFDLNTDEFSDVLTLGVFKVRQSTLEPDATKLDFVVADSIIGSTNYFREAFKSDGGTAVSYYIESEAENSNNLYLKVNEGISKTAGNWLDETGYPTRKVRVLPAKDARYYNEKSESEQAALPGNTPAEKAEINDFKVAQAFLNGTEERTDRLFVASIQKLQREGKAKVKHGQNVYPHGVYRKQMAEALETGNIPSKLDRIFELADNFDLFPIDITVEAGLGTVYVGTKGGSVSHFDDEEFFNIGDHTVSSTGLSGSGLYTTKIIDNRNEIDFLGHYDTIFETFKSFSQFQRKDNIFIADPLRYIFVQGRNSKTLTSKQRESGVNFSQHIYWPLRHMMTGGTKNSSYCTSYANWGFTNDKALNRPVWVPMSGFAAATMGNTDSNFYPWIAPAGFTRGLVSGITDLAFYPKQKERDQLYKIGLNPVANFPNEGFAIFGQKTMQAKPSAFDRINVRRLFLYLQKAVMNTVKYFVFEPNTLFTRTQVLNVLRPIFEEVKNTQGMFDYLLVCDERNNSPDVIDRNELVVDIYIKPTRAAEFILVNFYATRTGQDFSELVS
jgi:hypothetical protein